MQRSREWRVKKTRVARDTEKEVTVRDKKVHLKWNPWKDDDFQQQENKTHFTRDRK
jgi:hypothetical protein